MSDNTIAPREWYSAFRREIRRPRWAEPLREAALAGRLGDWTQHLTDVVVSACESVGWAAVARGHLTEVGAKKLSPLPVPKQEYLGIDVMAFPKADRPGWRRPVAVFELENQQDLEAISYSIWKVSMVRCSFGGVFCYRRQPEEIKDLLSGINQGVMREMDFGAGLREAKVFLVVGTRSKAEDFPDGFFKPYVWDHASRYFRPLW